MMAETIVMSTVSTPNQEEGSSGPSRRSRKRAGPFKRSRTGCGTCKKRGKKCDEEWTEDGYCQRCITGEFMCLGRTLQPTKNGSASNNRNTSERSRSQGQSRPRKASRASDDGWDSPVSPSQLLVPPESSSSRASGSGVEHVPPPLVIPPDCLPVPPADPLPPLPPITPSTTADHPSVPFAWYNPHHAHTPAPAHDPTSFLTIHQAEELLDWTSMFGVGSEVGSRSAIGTGTEAEGLLSAAPVAGMVTTECGGLGMEALSWNSTPDHLGVGAFGLPPGLGVESIGQCRFRNGVDLSNVYARLIDTWIPGVTSSRRECLRGRLLTLNESSPSLKNTKYALALTYIPLLSSSLVDPMYPSSLNFLARQASATPFGGSFTSLPIPAEKGKEREHLEDFCEKSTRARLRHHDVVMNSLKCDKELTKWVEEGLSELSGDIARDRLSDTLWALINLHHINLARTGATFSVLSLGDRIVKTAMGDNHPTLELTQLRDSGGWSLKIFAVMDLGRCIVERGRKTIFNFYSDPSITAPVEDEIPYLGLPDQLLILLSQIVNLCAEALSSSPDIIKPLADKLEKSIRSWVNPGITADEGSIERALVGELWRWSALVLVYQSIFRVGSLHPVLIQSHTQLSSLLSALASFTPGSAPYTALPAFLAATLSYLPGDREVAKQNMRKVGVSKAWEENLGLVEKVWEEVDRTGRSTDWWDLGRKEGMGLVFL